MARRAVDDYLRHAGADEDERADVVLALDEACVNVIRHAFPHRRRGRLRLKAEVTAGEVRVEVEDDGVGFDPLANRGTVTPMDTSGRGLRIIQKVMTAVALESPTENGGTRVVMQKALAVPAPLAGAPS